MQDLASLKVHSSGVLFVLLSVLFFFLDVKTVHGVQRTTLPRTCVYHRDRRHVRYMSNALKCPCLVRHTLDYTSLYSTSSGAKFDFLVMSETEAIRWRAENFRHDPWYEARYSITNVKAPYISDDMEIMDNKSYVLAIRGYTTNGVDDCGTSVRFVFEEAPRPCPVRLTNKHVHSKSIAILRNTHESTHHVVAGTPVQQPALLGVLALVPTSYGDCTGALVSSSWILTAAHCKPSIGTKVRVGGLDTSYTSGTTHEITESHQHPEYRTNSSSGLAVADLVVLRIVPPVHGVRPLPLNLFPHTPVNEYVRASGYGRISENWAGSRNKPRKLHSVDLPTVSPEECRVAFSRRGAPAIANGLHDGAHLCAGYTQTDTDSDTPVCRGDTCGGDSGGPLLALRAGSYVLVGITSGGLGCARPGLPGVYVRISRYAKWIINITGGAAFDVKAGGVANSNVSSEQTHKHNLPTWAIASVVLGIILILVVVLTFAARLFIIHTTPQTDFASVTPVQSSNPIPEPPEA